MKKQDLKRYRFIWIAWKDKRGKLFITKFRTPKFVLKKAKDVLQAGGIVLTVWGE